MTNIRSIGFLGLVLLALSGCESFWLGTAGEMRVEVEVYKGPLSQSRAIQVGELQAVLADSTAIFARWAKQANDVVAQCKPEKKISGTLINRACGYNQPCNQYSDPGGCQMLEDAVIAANFLVTDLCRVHINPLRVGKEHTVYTAEPEKTNAKDPNRDQRKELCVAVVNEEKATGLDFSPQYKNVYDEYAQIRDALIGLNGNDDQLEEARKAIRLIASIAGSLKSKAFVVAYGFNGDVPKAGSVRRELVDFALLAGEFSNQLQSRNAVLAKQLEDNIKTSLLPVSDYLRDSSNTDFVKLLDWYKASETPEFGYRLDNPPLNRAARVRASERLFRDYYWEKINEVYASGLGQASMAFIKNDVGNWELKSFSNDPTKLLNAYSNVADAALKSAVKLATNAATGGAAGAADAAASISSASKLVNLANVLSSGQNLGAAPAAGQDIKAIHERTKARLVSEQAGYRKRETAILDAIKGEDDNIAKANETTMAEKEKIRQADDEIKVLQDLVRPENCDSEEDAKQCEKFDKKKQLIEEQNTAKSAAEKNVAQADKDIETAKTAKAAANTELQTLRKTALAAIDQILKDHQQIISALQTAAVPAASPVPGATLVPDAGTGDALNAAADALRN